MIYSSQMNAPQNQTDRPNTVGSRGFTLVELLVTLAILTVLSVLTTSFVQNAMRKGKQAACMSNMRNIGAALHIYASENNGEFPETTHSTTLDRAWIYALEEHMGRFDECRICPADPKRQQRLDAKGSSYTLNSYVFVPATDAFGRPREKALNRIVAIPDLNRTLLAVVCSDHVGVAAGNDHTHSDRWTSWAGVVRDVATNRHGKEGSDGTDGGSNYLYADGHVEFIQAMQLKRRVESGDNPALPPGIIL